MKNSLPSLRTWWGHRKQGENRAAIAALGTEKMKLVVDKYTRHFFDLAHCIVVHDKVQPPRSLYTKMKELDKLRSKNKKAAFSSREMESWIAGTAIRADVIDPNLTPLENLHVAQRRLLELTGGTLKGPLTNQKGHCVPGKIDLDGLLDEIRDKLAHRVGILFQQEEEQNHGDPNTTPVVFVSTNGDFQIVMKVDRITCAHCVKIIETVLQGCDCSKSPISGLLDVAADRDLGSILIKIDKVVSAKRVAFEAARNLSMVGYTAEPMAMNVVSADADPISHTDLGALATAFEVVATAEPMHVFDWAALCTCPDNGVFRSDCARYVAESRIVCAVVLSFFFTFSKCPSFFLFRRHSQMSTQILDAFSARKQHVTEYIMTGHGMKGGMVDCTCGPGSRCKNCPAGGQQEPQTKSTSSTLSQGLGLPSPSVTKSPFHAQQLMPSTDSEFDRAMLELEASIDAGDLEASIDWGGFDISVDHSAHTDEKPSDQMNADGSNGAARRSSIVTRRQSFMSRGYPHARHSS
jgi:copper chaperone CopZ